HSFQALYGFLFRHILVLGKQAPFALDAYETVCRHLFQLTQELPQVLLSFCSSYSSSSSSCSSSSPSPPLPTLLFPPPPLPALPTLAPAHLLTFFPLLLFSIECGNGRTPLPILVVLCDIVCSF